jgi:hypothetical protein
VAQLDRSPLGQLPYEADRRTAVAVRRRDGRLASVTAPAIQRSLALLTATSNSAAPADAGSPDGRTPRSPPPHIEDPDRALNDQSVDASRRLRRRQVGVVIDQACQLVHLQGELFPLAALVNAPDVGPP